MTDLLPCPFCGKPPFVDDDRDGVCSVSCANDDCLGVEITCPTLDDAREFWNTRAPQCLPVAQTEQVREALALGRDAVMESFNHIADRDDQLLADARLQSIDAAIAGQPRAEFVSLPISLVQRLRDHLEQTDSFVWLDEIEMLSVALTSALPSPNGDTP